MTPAELIERLEKATGPDRATEWEIHCRDGIDGVGAYGAHPAYMNSIDAALELVPEGFDWRCGEFTWASGETRRPEAVVFLPHAQRSTKTAPRINSAATPAIALCIAALRARAALPTESAAE